MHPTLLDSAKYKRFTADRDRALEQIHQNAQVDLSRITHEMLEYIEHLSASLAIRSKHTHLIHQISNQFETGVREIMSKSFPIFLHRIVSMRKAVFVMTYASEQEAIGQATQRKKFISRQHFKSKLGQALTAETIMGPFEKRVWLNLMKLRHRIVAAFELAATQELKPEEIVAKVADSFPEIQVYRRAPKTLKKLRETRVQMNPKSFATFDFIDDADWDWAVDAYRDTELPAGRFDQIAQWEDDGTAKYNWEIEQEATEDFVRAVRDGKIEAAADLGIKDFVWVAVIDDHTCEECCLPRNGKTSQEIETMLDNGKISDDCDAVTAPAHFKCRCDNAPVASVDEVEGPNWQSFNEWLEAA